MYYVGEIYDVQGELIICIICCTIFAQNIKVDFWKSWLLTTIYMTVPMFNITLAYVITLSLELRRLHIDLIMCYKIVFGIANVKFDEFFKRSSVAVSYTHLTLPTIYSV